MPLIQRKGSQSAQGFGEFLQAGSTADPAYIENIFSTFVYEGTGAAQTITTNFNTADYQSLIWIKNFSGNNHCLTNTITGATNYLSTNTTSPITNDVQSLISFGTTGFSVGTSAFVNGSGSDLVSWSFRKQTKFFDMVTYTGTGTVQNISHNLGSTPGFMVVKCTDDASSDWVSWHKDLTSSDYYILLNDNAVEASNANVWNSTAPTSSVFTVGSSSAVNKNGQSYIVYLFASDAGGFGASGLENVISCGTYTGNGSAAGPTITLGYEPQFFIVKSLTNSTSDWYILDNIRSLAVYFNKSLYANDTNGSNNVYFNLTSSGFKIVSGNADINGSGQKHIYIAIRRGPMQTPTAGQSVFIPIARAGTGAAGSSTAFGTVTDLVINKSRNATQRWVWTDRLRGQEYELQSQNSNAEIAPAQDVKSFSTMTGYTFGNGGGATAPVGAINTLGNNYIDYLFKRAPGFFDQVVYTGTGATTTINHNLTVAPELIIIKRMQTATDWGIYNSTIGNTNYLVLNSTAAAASSSTFWNNTSPTSSVFTVSTAANVNNSGSLYTAYLFATLANVSKVGSYSGTGSTITVDCGFTGGARFVMIKRTDTTGDWYMWDTARGMTSGTDPYSLFNSSAIEVNADNILSVTTGFQVVGTGAGINASGGTYIFLAIA